MPMREIKMSNFAELFGQPKLYPKMSFLGRGGDRFVCPELWSPRSEINFILYSFAIN